MTTLPEEEDATEEEEEEEEEGRVAEEGGREEEEVQGHPQSDDDGLDKAGPVHGQVRKQNFFATFCTGCFIIYEWVDFCHCVVTQIFCSLLSSQCAGEVNLKSLLTSKFLLLEVSSVSLK